MLTVEFLNTGKRAKDELQEYIVTSKVNGREIDKFTLGGHDRNDGYQRLIVGAFIEQRDVDFLGLDPKSLFCDCGEPRCNFEEKKVHHSRLPWWAWILIGFLVSAGLFFLSIILWPMFML